MPTTSFIDVKFQEKVDKYVYENKEYSFDEGETVSMPRHTAFSFVNKQEIAKYASDPYDVKDEEYEDVLMRSREKGVETCDEVKSDGEVCGREKPCSYHDKENEEE